MIFFKNFNWKENFLMRKFVKNKSIQKRERKIKKNGRFPKD